MKHRMHSEAGSAALGGSLMCDAVISRRHHPLRDSLRGLFRLLARRSPRWRRHFKVAITVEGPFTGPPETAALINALQLGIAHGEELIHREVQEKALDLAMAAPRAHEGLTAGDETGIPPTDRQA